MATLLYSQDFDSVTDDYPSGWTATGTASMEILTAVEQAINGWGTGSNYTGASGLQAFGIGNGGSSVTGTITCNDNISTIGYTGLYVTVGMFKEADAVTPIFEWSSDGSNWNSISFADVASSASWIEKTIDLPASAGNVSNLRFRFTWTYSGLESLSVSMIDDFRLYYNPNFNIKDTPQQYEPVHNELPFVVSGTNNSNTNYKYWCDVYFAGSTSYDYRLFTFPRPDGFGFFNLKTIIRDYVSGDIDIDDDNFERNTNTYKGYNVYFGESYGSTGTVTSGIVSSGTYFAFNGSLTWDEFVDYSQNTRAIRTTGTAKFLTNLNQGLAFSSTTYNRIGLSENAFIHMAQKENTAISYMNIVTYDSAGSVNGTFRVQNTYSTVTDNDNNRFIRFPCGTANLLNIPSASISVISGALPIIDSDVYYYSLQTLNSSLFATSYMVTFKVEDKCSKYDTYRVHYLNKWSGFDSFTFSAKNIFTNDIERKQYKKKYGSISSAGDWSYSKSERGITDYDTRYKRKLMLKSDWITEDEYDLLTELISSPEVYIEISGELQAINILTASYEERSIANNKLLNIEIECEFTQYSRRQ